MKVSVTFSSTAITSVKVDKHNETPGVGEAAVKTLPGKIVEGQTLNVDVTADQAGASVIVIEKMPKVGGNTIISGAAYNSADPERQAKSPASAGPEATVMALVNAKPASDPHAQMQAQLKKEYEAYKASGSQTLFDSPTLHALQTYEGGDRVGDLSLIKNYTSKTLDGVKWLESLGMKFGDTCFTVLGALWQRSHKPVKPLGTGYIDSYTTYLSAHNVPIMLETKATHILMDKDRAVGVQAVGPTGNIEQGVEDRIFVNKQGDRFVDEGARRDVMTEALFKQQDSSMWVILDKHSYPTGDTKNNFNETIDELVAAGRAYKADTLEELAAKIKVPAANLAKAVSDFNAAVDKQAKDPFGRTLFSHRIDTAPFYAGARVPTVHHTMGGLKVNADDQVIDTKGVVIPGLYAAGEVTGGLHGSNRLGGNALADTVVNGRIAGASAAAGK